MFVRARQLRSSPTDLANFLVCRHKTALDLGAARGDISKPSWEDPLSAVLRDRGQAHEQAYVASLLGQGLRVVDLSLPDDVERPTDEAAIARTLAAMRDGADVIVQAALGGRLETGSGIAGPLWF